jgi:hypothetical protein
MHRRAQGDGAGFASSEEPGPAASEKAVPPPLPARAQEHAADLGVGTQHGAVRKLYLEFQTRGAGERTPLGNDIVLAIRSDRQERRIGGIEQDEVEDVAPAVETHRDARSRTADRLPDENRGKMGVGDGTGTVFRRGDGSGLAGDLCHV